MPLGTIHTRRQLLHPHEGLFPVKNWLPGGTTQALDEGQHRLWILSSNNLNTQKTGALKTDGDTV